MPVGAAIIGLIILAIVFNSPRKQRWKCPACDFSVEAEKTGAAKEHTLLHAKHQPTLKDE
jgi:transposase-like protein